MKWKEEVEEVFWNVGRYFDMVFVSGCSVFFDLPRTLFFLGLFSKHLQLVRET